MKNFRFTILILIIGLLGYNFTTPAKKNVVTITAQITNCGEELGLYRFDGVGFKLIQSTKAKEAEPFVFKVEAEETTILYLGENNKQKRPVVIGPEKEIVLKGDCKNIRSAAFLKSDWNKQYDQVIKKIQAHKTLKKRYQQKLQQAKGSTAGVKKYEENMAALDKETNIFIDSISAGNAFLGKLAAIDSYKSFAVDKRNYTSEVEHFGKEFFSDVPLEDPAYDHLTFLFEAFREYSNTLGKTNAPANVVNNYIEHSLKRIEPNRPAFKTALGGIVLGLQSAQHPSFIYFGDLFIHKYKDSKAAHIVRLEEQLNGAKALQNGGIAPDFTAKTPEGVELSLSDLKGQYVLIDFWASWCGPCRRENPKVVKLYEKYHDKGFEILGVSLDNNKSKWEAAIEKDGLQWPHISDLKGWQSGPAKIYGVRSIPSTVLLDKEGKIIVRNLRAHQLEGKLKEIFGK